MTPPELIDRVDGLDPDRLFAGIEPQGIVLLGISGGGDSLALLLLAKAWVERSAARGRDVTLHAVTIDHGLRPEAAAEAAFVAGVAEGLGIDHTTLSWEGMKPSSGLPDAARRARYGLMAEFAGDIGAELLMTAHTAEDQAETVFMRLMRENAALATGRAGAGRGLSGMARRAVLERSIMLVRPLLGVSRAALRDYLVQAAQAWIEDPSNHDPSYERVRVRRVLEADRALTARLLRFAAVMARRRALTAAASARLLSRSVKLLPGAVLLHQTSGDGEVPFAAVMHAMQALIALAGGAEQLVPLHRVEQALSGLAHGDVARVTLGGAVLERVPGGLRFWREARGQAQAMVPPGETVLWDGRLEVTNRSGAMLEIGPLTRAGLMQAEADRDRTLPVRPRAALHATAVITRPGRSDHLPLLEAGDGTVATRLTARAIERFCPETDFPLLAWMRRLDSARQTTLRSSS